MVSTLAASLLTKYLGDYLDDLTKDNIKLSLLSGEAVINDVKIKQTALQKLFPSIIVKQATVRKLSLYIPWNQIKNKPAIIRLEGIYVLAESCNTFDEEYYRRKIQDEKQQKLMVQELLRAKLAEASQNFNSNIKSNSNSVSDDQNSSFSSRLFATVVDNLQLYIDSVHIRFEDQLENSSFAVGIMMKQLVAESTDENWKPSFLKNESSIIHKIINLSDLSIYWNSNSPKLKYSNIDDLTEQLKSMIYSPSSPSTPSSPVQQQQKQQTQYILPKLSSCLKAIINKNIINTTTNNNQPKVSVKLDLDDTKITLSDQQYQDITNIMESFSMFKRNIEFRSQRPTKSIKESPKKWWAFAIHSIVGKIHERRYKHSWLYLFEFLKDKKEYIKLFKKFKRQTIHSTEKTRMDALEWKLSFEHIQLFRNLAYRMMEKEAKLEEKQKKESLTSPKLQQIQQPQLQPQQPVSGGWFSSWWSTPTTTTTSTATTNKQQDDKKKSIQEEIKLSKEDWEEIYDTIGYEELDSKSVSPGRGSSNSSNIDQFRVDVRLLKLSLGLERKKQSLAILQFDNLNLSLKSREDSYSFDVKLDSIELVDKSTLNTRYPKLISPCPEKINSLPTSPMTSSTTSSSSPSTPSKLSIFNLQFNSLPKGSDTDYSIAIQSKPLTIVYYPLFVSTIIDFFRVNSSSVDTFEDLGKMAQSTIQNIKTQTHQRLMLAISHRTTLSLDMQLEAPIILIPEDICENSVANTLILDLGYLSINHKPKSIESKQQQPSASTTDINEDWDEDFYDEYRFQLSNIQILLAYQNQDWRDVQQVAKHRMNIANPFNANFQLKLSRIRNHILTSIKLDANIDLLEFYLSSQQYVNFIGVIQAITSVSQSDLESNNNNNNSNKQQQQEELELLLSSAADKHRISEYSLLETRFTCKRFNVHLRIENEQNVQNLALVYMRMIDGVFKQRYFDTIVSLCIKGLWIEDCFLKEPGGGNYLAFTNSRVTLDTIESADPSTLNMMTFFLKQISSESPNYQKVDKELNIDFSQLNLILNKKTVAGVIEFSNSVQSLTLERLQKRHLAESISQQRVVVDNVKLIQPTDSMLPSWNDAKFKSVQQIVNTRVNVKVTFVRVLLTQENNTPLIKASINDFACTNDIYINRTTVVGKLGSLKIHDMTLEGRNYRTIFTTKERRVATGGISTTGSRGIESEDNFNIPSDISSPASLLQTSSTSLFDNSDNISLVHFQFESRDNVHFLKCSLSSIRFVFLNRFIDEIKNFFNSVNTMRDYLKQSISSAATVISQARSTFLYEIEIENPYVIIPISSLSHQVFIVDLGKIIISNRFEDCSKSTDKEDITEIDYINGSGVCQVDVDDGVDKRLDTSECKDSQATPDKSKCIIIEHIYIEANNLKLLSGLDIKMIKSPSGRLYGTMVKDVNLNIHLSTPMSLAGADPISLPPWERIFDISQFQLDISEYESKCLIQLLDGNLSESSSSINTDPMLKDENNNNQQQEITTMVDEQEQSKDSSNNDNEDEEGEDDLEKKFHRGSALYKLGKFSITFMKRDGSTVEDRMVQFLVNDMKMSIINEPMETSLNVEIMNIILNDFNKETHPHFRQLLHPNTTANSNNTSRGDPNLYDGDEAIPQLVINGTIKPPPIQQSAFQVSLGSMNMIFVPHSWLEVQSSITRLITTATEAWSRYTTKIMGAPPVGVDEIIESGSSLLTLHIGDATISIPTNARTSGQGEKEYALIIRASLDLQNTSKGALGVETVSLVEAENIQVYRTQWNNHFTTENSKNNNNNNIKNQVKMIEPFKFHFQTTSTAKNQESNVVVDQVNVNFSYQDFKQLMLISNNIIQSKPTPAPVPTTQNEPDQSEVADEAISYIGDNRAQTVDKQIMISFKLDKGLFTLHNDVSEEENIPLIQISVSKLKHNSFMWTLKDQIAFSVESNMEASYFNGNSGVWEPLVETWGFMINTNNSKQGGWISDFISKLPLQINITKGFVDTSLSTYQLLVDDYYQNSKPISQTTAKQQAPTINNLKRVNSLTGSGNSVPNTTPTANQQITSTTTSTSINNNNNIKEKDTKVYPYYIRNSTGQTVWYWFSSEELREIPIGKEIPLSNPEFNKVKSKGIDIERKISFQLYGNFKPITNLPMDTIGTYTIHPMPEYKSVKLLYDISYRKGSKVLSLHSNIIIRNQMNNPMMVYISVGQNRELDPMEMIVESKSSTPLPILYSMGRLRIKPYNPSYYNYSVEQVNCINVIQLIKERGKQKEKSSTSVHSRMICKHSSRLPFILITSIDKDIKKNKNQIEISIFAPLIIENVLACDLNFRLYHSKGKKLIGSPFLEGVIPMGEKVEVTVFDPSYDIFMEIQIYDFSWSQPFVVEPCATNPEHLNTKEKIKILDNNKSPLLISFDNRVEPYGSRVISVYCEFWMINQSGLPVVYRHHIGAQTINPAGQPIPLSGENSKPEVLPLDSIKWYNSEWASPSKPFMFAYNDSNIVGGRFSMKVANSEWSSPFSLNSSSANSNSTISIKEEKTSEEKKMELLMKKIPEKRLFELSVTCLPSNSRYWRTRVVTFCPQQLIVNTTPFTVYYQQFECHENTQSLLSNQSLPFNFPSVKRDKLIRIGLKPQDSSNNSIMWSGYFNPRELGNIIVRLRTDSDSTLNPNLKDSDINARYINSNSNQSTSPKIFLSVSIRVKATKMITTNMIVISEQNPELPPYCIDNRTRFPLWIRQKKTENWEKLASQTSTPYTWDHFILPRKLVIEFPGNEKQYYRLNNLEENSVVSTKVPTATGQSEKVEFEISINAHGPTRVLVVRERVKNTSSPVNKKGNESKPLSSSVSSTNSYGSQTSNTTNIEEYGKFEVKVNLISIGLSIVNQVPEEFIYCSFDKLYVEFKQNKFDQFLQITLDDIQIDDQRYQTNFPVFLCRTRKPFDDQNNNSNSNNNNNNNPNNKINNNSSGYKPFFQFSSTRSLKYPKILFFRYFSFLIQEFDLNIDESSILNVLSFINVNLNSLNQHFTLHQTITSEEILQVESTKMENMIYFELLHINPLKVNLSFNSCKLPKEVAAILGARSLLELLLGIKSSSAFLNVDRAPMHFNGFIWEHPFLSIKQVTDEMVLHFSYQLMGQVHKIFGSFDFIGNPIRLAESLGSGFKDFFHEPALGLVKSPQDFAIGLSKGTSSLVNNSVFGICESASKITGTISKGLVHLSLDDSYIKEREEVGRQKPTGLKQGIEFGIRDLGEGLIKGITGIIDEPIKGVTQEKSIEGFLKGVGKGVIGVAVKPTVGLFEFATRTSEGMKNATTIAKSIMQIKRRRLPRYFPKDGTLQNYNTFKSQGATLLYSKLGPPPTNSWYVFHCVLSNTQTLASSTDQLILLSNATSTILSNNNEFEIVWQVKITDIQNIQVHKSTNLISIIHKNPDSPQGEPITRSIHAPSEDVKISISKKIAELKHLKSYYK